MVLGLFRLKGWSVAGRAPGVRKCVILGAPHTSNWDFVFFLGVTDYFGFQPGFMGKLSLFKGPLGQFMLDMGGVPVDRSGGRNVVDAVAAEFARRDDLMLVIAPEGTRSGADGWRSGFYHIARAANVPVVCGWFNLAEKRGGLSAPIDMTGDQAADMARIAAFYQSVMPGHPRVARIALPD